MTFNFTAFFEKVGVSIVRELKKKMFEQMGVDGKNYGALKPATVNQKMKISTATANLRMIRTKDFLNFAYLSQPIQNGLRVWISKAKHGRAIKSMLRTLQKYKTEKYSKQKIWKQAVKAGQASTAAPTYEDIAKWQLETNQSDFFPATVAEIENLKSVRTAREDFKREAFTQLKSQMILNISRELRVG